MNEYLEQTICLDSLIYIKWQDADEFKSHWVEPEDVKEFAESEPPIMLTAGFLVVNAPTHVCVVGTVGPEETSDVLKIPRGMILEMKLIPLTMDPGMSEVKKALNSWERGEQDET